MIVERYKDQVAHTVYGMLGVTPEAEDIGQEVFIRFYTNLDKFRNDSSIGTYLTRIAINLSLNQIKKNSKKDQLFEQKLPDSLHDTYNRVDYEQIRQVKQAILKLEPRYRLVVVLRLVQGFSTRETAEILKVPQGTVMSWLSRAQKILRENLS